jgi:hypothetical protein
VGNFPTNKFDPARIATPQEETMKTITALAAVLVLSIAVSSGAMAKGPKGAQGRAGFGGPPAWAPAWGVRGGHPAFVNRGGIFGDGFGERRENRRDLRRDLRENRRDLRGDIRDNLEALRDGDITRREFRRLNAGDRREFRIENRQDRREFRRENRRDRRNNNDN